MYRRLRICRSERAKGNVCLSEAENQEAKFLSTYSMGRGMCET